MLPTTVNDVMTRTVVSVHPETPLKEVARLLVARRISGLPVVDHENNVVGVVSEADFLAKEQGPTAIPHRRLARVLGESGETRAQLAKQGAITAGQAMTSPALTIESTRSMREAAQTMVSHAVNRLPVVDRGALVGIVTRADLMRAFVLTDDHLAETIRDKVLLRTFWLNPVLFDVVVLNGVARIRGRVECRSTAEMIAEVVAIVPGVVGVAPELTWDFDDREIRAPGVDLVGPLSVH
jgi:CBS domain-containing protein